MWLAISTGFKILVHLTQMSPGEIEALPSWAGLVANPRANAFFVWRLPRIDSLAARGALIGTDNVAAVEPDLWEEMRFAYYAARAAGQRVSARDVYAMATANAWRALGICPPIIPGHTLRAVAVSTGGYPVDRANAFEFLVKRGGAARLVALFHGTRVEPLTD